MNRMACMYVCTRYDPDTTQDVNQSVGDWGIPLRVTQAGMSDINVDFATGSERLILTVPENSDPSRNSSVTCRGWERVTGIFRVVLCWSLVCLLPCERYI